LDTSRALEAIRDLLYSRVDDACSKGENAGNKAVKAVVGLRILTVTVAPVGTGLTGDAL
jgi:hypothetical protein